MRPGDDGSRADEADTAHAESSGRDSGAKADGGGTDSARIDAVSHFTTARPVAVMMVFLAAVVFGYFSYLRLPVTLMPELSYPTITVRTEYPGAAPEEVEKDISRPIEEALGVIGGLRRLSSVSRAGVSDVVLEFTWDTNMSDAIQDTLEKLDLVVLSEDAGPSLILRFDPSLDPVMELSLASARIDDAAATGSASNATGEGDSADEAELRRLRRIAELQIKPALEPVKGVASVRVRGGLEEEIHVLIDRGKLTRLGISITAIVDRLAEENINLAGGTVKEGRTDYMVRTLNEYANVEEIAATVVTLVDGREVRISDLAHVVRTHKEREMITRTGGRESEQIDIFKEADANMVDLADRVNAALGQLPQPDPSAGGDGASGADGNDGASAKAGKENRAARGGAGPGGPMMAQRIGLSEQLFNNEDVRLEVVSDRSIFIESSIDEVRNTALLGGLLAIVILFFFLENLRSTVIIALSIPISMMVAFAPLNLLGVSLNIMSLGGLALGIGMLVDSSIVVLESIYRCREEGDDLLMATIRGTRDVRGAVVASILTTIGVFLPMVFVEGVAGQAFGDLGLAVVMSLLASLVVALVFIPMLASRRGLQMAAKDFDLKRLFRLGSIERFAQDFAATRTPFRWFLLLYLVPRLLLATVVELVGRLLLVIVVVLLGIVRRLIVPVIAVAFRYLCMAPLWVSRSLLRVLGALYPRWLAWSLRHSGVIMAIIVASLAFVYVAFERLSSELLPEVHQGEFTVEVALPVGTPLEETETVLAPVEAAILAESEHIETLLVTMGYDPANTQRADEGEHTARFKVVLRSSDNMDNAAVEALVAGRIRQRLVGIPDLESRLVRPVLFSFRTPIEVEIYGDDLRRLRDMAERVEYEMGRLSELTDVETTLQRGAPEVQIVYDRDRLRRQGLNVGDVAQRVRDEVQGTEATRLNLGDRRVPIVVRLDEGDRASVADIEELIIDPEGTRAIRLASVAEVVLGEGPSEVRRVDGNRVALVRANLAPGASLGAAVAAIEAGLNERVAWSADMSFRVAGQNQEWERSQSSLWLALGLSVFLVYVIMAAQFESLLYPLIIMFAIPLAFVGTFAALWGLAINLSIVVFLGMIMLAGIVVNNAIVLVDYIGTLKRRGLKLEQAVIQAGSVRLRPILMTTATTVLGLVPMALGLGDGAEIRTPLAITVISGLIASTALTLIAIPTVYFVIDQLAARIWQRPAPLPRALPDAAVVASSGGGERNIDGVQDRGQDRADVRDPEETP